VRAMRERVEKLEGSLTQREQAAYTQAKQKTSAEVNAFAAANPAPTEPLGTMDDTMRETLREDPGRAPIEPTRSQMASPNSTFTELVSTTFRKHRKEIKDNLSTRNAL
jgi:hypothetical protein